MSELNNVSNYRAYVNSVREEAPKSDNKGQVSKNVKFFEKDAFVEHKLPSPYKQYNHSHEQCQNYESSLQSWKKREGSN